MRRRARRTALLCAAALLLPLSLTACSGGSGNDGTVRFGYIGDYNGSSLLAIADKEGLWKKAGLKPDVKVFNNGPIQIQALGAGDLDFGYIGPGAMWLPASGKSKVIAIDTLTTADRVIGQPGIDSIQALKGKKVGVVQGTSGEMVLDLALKKAGMTEKDLQVIPMDASTIVSAFDAGKIDGAGIWYPLLDTIKKNRPGLHEIASDTDFPQDSFPTAFVAGNKTDPKLVSKVEKVLQEANDWRSAHPAQSISLAAAMLHVSTAETTRDAANVKTMTTAQLVAATKDGTVGKWLDSLSGFFVQSGQLKQAPAASTYYEGDLYTKAYTR
ncbi:aliphatic sulfonate ABC transporter substrate-binding protein [Phaeacidiphilus oryzae]|uniref:aliphatic sulfonate ABC transporter substrate-binding protein n=1 Tax=Phaeacidiphilus oryzae TaxID=348818 RepID=UPI000691A56E|nr:aliphatic sulfonate ABC transporter substrate-binding protein [Phaeacidiphilus oryzae]